MLWFRQILLLFGFLFILPRIAMAYDISEVPSITVLAEGQLAIPLAQITSEFTRSQTSNAEQHKQMLSISNYFGVSEVQKKKIDDGESADIFITSQPDLIQQLKIKGLVDIYSISKIAAKDGKNYTVAVVLSENMNHARIFLEFLKAEEAKSVFVKNGFATP